MSTADSQTPQLVWERLSGPERDAAYNNNAAVANSAEWLAARDAAASAFRITHPEGLDIVYGPRARNRLDIFAAKDPTAPCLVFIHGGYWQRNSKEAFAHLAEGLLAHGWSVVMPGYTLAPEVGLTQIVAEIGAALDFLARNGPAHGIAGPLVLGGWSAGAQLAALHLDHPAVAAGLAISGVYDLGPIRDTFLNVALKLTDAEVVSFSPLLQPPSAKPLVIAYGTAELPALIYDSRALSARRATAEAPGALLPIPGADHFSILEELRRRDGQLTRAVLNLLPASAV